MSKDDYKKMIDAAKRLPDPLTQINNLNTIKMSRSGLTVI